jgi:cytochrome c oxidase assembly factor CtaG
VNFVVNPLSSILEMWSWEPSILLGIAIFLGLYLAAVGPLRKRFKASSPVRHTQVTWFILGTLVIFLALVSPLDELGDNYLFSAHMLQHSLLVFVVPPLLLAGTPAWLADALIRPRLIHPLARILTHPISAYLLFNLVFAIWHFPALYQAALDNQNVHIFEHLCFMVTAVLNWWPVLSHSELLPRLSAPVQMVYLFLEGIPCTVLGAVIIFQPTILYPAYLTAPSLLGISPMTDQQIAGLIMAMPGGMAYMIAMTVVFFNWQKKEATSPTIP